jgi:hypothetical protein
MIEKNEITISNPGIKKIKNAFELEKLILSEIEEVIYVLVDIAKSGDVKASKILLDKVMADKKERELSCDFNINSLDDVIKEQKRVIEAMSRGEITPGEARTLLENLDIYKNSLYVQEFAEGTTEFNQNLKNLGLKK